jgi:hypothetical protein
MQQTSEEAHASILGEVERSLAEARYQFGAYRGSASRLWFEDESLLGIVAVFPSATALLNEWRGVQDAFLASEADSLVGSPDKAWNVYCVLLTPGSSDGAVREQLSRVEEDLSCTRKIVGTALLEPADIRLAIAPLLPVRAVPLPHEDLSERLRSALNLSEASTRALLLGDARALAAELLRD